MSPDVFALHARRFRRMLQDLDIDPGAVLADRNEALWDAVLTVRGSRGKTE